MALDGIVIANIVHELNVTLSEGRIQKIAQPEKDELILSIKTPKGLFRLLISASASLPLIYLTGENKPSPLTAPNFCMLLRKHLNSARILRITQPGLERVIDMEIEHLNDLGDRLVKHLMIELMGKHSNIIFCENNDQMKIIDSIKRVSTLVSSVREVLPGREYFIPETQNKKNPLNLDFETFQSLVLTKPMSVSKALYNSLTGLSPLAANEICCRASIDSDADAGSLNENEVLHLFRNLERVITDIKEHNFYPNIVYENDMPLEFSSIRMTCYEGSDFRIQSYETVSELLEEYYAVKNTITRIRQKSSDLRKIVSNALEKSVRKYDLQSKQLNDTQKRDRFKVYGELINTYGYNLEESASSLTCMNYYDNEEITIPLDPLTTPTDNAKRYFEKYNKLKRTFEAVTKQLEETREEIRHLESISNSLDIALKEEDLAELKQELTEYGYMRRKNTAGKKQKKEKITSKPFHYVTADGFHIYVGKNNYQNEELTFKFADGNDWWFHAKGIAGSHVVVKTNGEALPDRIFTEAGSLAAYYSKGREMEKVEIDYTEKKNVKKPGGGKPGFVVYYTNYSLMARPLLDGLTLIG